MATIVLKTAGAVLGGFLGPVGAIIGGAVGSLAGYAIDQQLLGGGRNIEGPRLSGMQPFSAEEGTPVPRLYGTARMGGTVIWATRFEEDGTTKRQGAKGGPKVTNYTYYANVAFALCEGSIASVRRVWADGQEIDLELVEMRVHRGDENQLPDPLIEAKQGFGNTPAYRGTAYVVFERLPLEAYGNRIPQFHFEILRPIGGFGEKIRAITLIPGSTEYGLSGALEVTSAASGSSEAANRHVFFAGTDLTASLEELQSLCPNLEHVALVVSWFGSDLRAGHCVVKPAVITNDPQADAALWTVAGMTRQTAPVVSQVDGKPAYGGTPTDQSVRSLIADLKLRGLKVTLYPFVMMDVPSGNALPDPYGAGEQAAYPWRGRITCNVAPGLPGTDDKSGAVTGQIIEFLGNTAAASPAFVSAAPDITATYNDWGYRRLVLHYTDLAAQAGGVDAFVIGSELRGLSQLRDGSDAFPFVHALRQIAGEVKAQLGASAKVVYAADWSEYFGYQPTDGSGDVYFHLDPLWADPSIDAVGIDNYMPLADWRDTDWEGSNPDGFASPYDRDGLKASISSGEGFDWYYPDQASRAARARASIEDGAYGKPWVFRYKDLRGWWESLHIERRGGVELASPTAWQPRSKPFWFTEVGSPAVDKGANQPNVFVDPKSSESFLPYYSNGARDDLIQRRFLEAYFEYWTPGTDTFDDAQNPVSPVYGGRMVDPDRIYCWTWDARPFPVFPQQTEVWSDGGNWVLGHWLNGRIDAVAISDLISAICADHRLSAPDVHGVDGICAGFVISKPGAAREAIEPLITLYGLSVHERGGQLVFSNEGRARAPAIIADPVMERDGPAQIIERTPDHELPDEAVLIFRNPFLDHQLATARIVRGVEAGRQQELQFPGALFQGQAESLVADWIDRKRIARSELTVSVPAGRGEFLPGDVIRIPERPGDDFLVEKTDEGTVLQIKARRIRRGSPASAGARLDAAPRSVAPSVGAPAVQFLDLPMVASGRQPEDRFCVAAWSRPWEAQGIQASPEVTGFETRNAITKPATIGSVLEDVPPGRSGLIESGYAIDVHLPDGELASVTRLQLLNGANAIAIRASNGVWEVVQFQDTVEFASGQWRLTNLLRGQLGTEDAMLTGTVEGAPVVVLNDAVSPAGLRSSEIGLTLNWRVGAASRGLTLGNYRQESHQGGLRALTPLSPVHLRAKKKPDGSICFSWIRRTRIDGDSWLPPEVPLGEESEAYLLRLARDDGTILTSVQTNQSEWIWSAAEIASAFPDSGMAVRCSVSQIGSAFGEGLPAEMVFTSA